MKLEEVVVLRFDNENISINTLTPFVLILRDLFYENDWENLQEDIKNNEILKTEAEKIRKIERYLESAIPHHSYLPISYDELMSFFDETGLKFSEMTHCSLEGIVQLAEDFADKNDLDTAIKFTDLMLKIDKDFAYAYELKGSYYIEKGEIEKGIKFLEKAITMDPWLIGAYSVLGETYYNMEQYEKAAQYWELEIEKAPNNKFTYFMIAEAYVKANKIDKAIKTLELLLERDSKDILAKYELIDLYKKSGKEDLAEKLEKEILSMVPYYSNDIEVWAKIKFKYGMYEDVAKFLEKKLPELETEDHLKLLLVIPYVKKGEIEKAKAILDEFKDKSVWYFYGKRELFSEFLNEKELEKCGIS